MVVIGATNRGLRGVSLTGIARRADQPRGRAIDAEVIGSGEVDQILGIDRPVQVVVQIATFWNVMQKGEQQLRLLSDGFQITRRLLFRGLRAGHSTKNNENPTATKNVRVHGPPSGNSGL